MTIAGAGRAFQRYLKGSNLGADTAGLYRFQGNLAVVSWAGDARTRAVARHEIAHLALGNWLGNTPLWLNEGIAELVEQMHFQQSWASAEVNRRTLARLQELERGGRLPALRTFLAANRAGI